MATIKSLGELEENIKDAVGTALAGEVYDKVMKTIYESAKHNIYDAYDPKDYNRRRTFTEENGYELNGGELSIEITAKAPFNPVGNTEANFGNVAELITGGDGEGGTYGWIPPSDRDPTYLAPRPWMREAKEQIESEHIFKNALVNALKRQGLNVK